MSIHGRRCNLYIHDVRSLVLLQSRSGGIGNGLSYEATPDVNVGALVNVELRKKITQGIVLDLEEKILADALKYELKPVSGTIGQKPLLSAAHIGLLKWMARYYYCTLRNAAVPFLPGATWKALLPTDIAGYRLLKPMEKGGAKQLAVTEFLHGKDWVSEEEMKSETGASKAVFTGLMKNGFVERIFRTESDRPSEPYNVSGSYPEFTPIQKSAYESIKNETKPSLLFGITGSGKTEIYAALIRDAAARGKQSILLVPEILLTEQTIHRFETLFDRDLIAVLHSKLTPAAKREEWKRIHSGKAALVIGSRSALFAPCTNLGLIIIDEEHEWTYKNEQTPRYHARETAEKLCELAGAKLVLGSATPSIEAWSRGQDGRYHIARLPERYQNRALPSVKIVDLANVTFGSVYPFSPTLIDAIEQRLKKGEQSVLFLNRRGVATSILCLDCRRRIVSNETQLPFTLHKDRNGAPYLLDHLSGVTANVPARCPHCNSPKLHPVGAGTQKLEELMKTIFPTARILRADRDTLGSPEEIRGILSAMRERKADILLGTQSVVKGLDLPGVTLAAVLVADVGLSLPHFRAGERIFQLLTQLAGRSGRAIPGDVIIQTFRPQAFEIVAASQHRTEDYLNTELSLRRTLHYPPIAQMIRFLVGNERAEMKARAFHKVLQKKIDETHASATASVAPTFSGAGKSWHIILRGTNLRELIKDIDLTNVIVDVDPVDVL